MKKSVFPEKLCDKRAARFLILNKIKVTAGAQAHA